MKKISKIELKKWRYKNHKKVILQSQKYRETYKEMYNKSGRKYYYKNKEKVIAGVIRWRKENPEKALKIIRAFQKRKQGTTYYRDISRKTLYGISKEQYQKMLKIQHRKCAICKSIFIKSPYVDHNHKTKKVRKLLCNNCNLIFGHAKDKIIILQKAINYLKKEV